MAIYTVEAGDTIWSIAEQFGASPERLMEDNGIIAPDHLVVGQALLILTPEQIHIARWGETLAQIAERYDTSILALMQNNPGLAVNQGITAGQELVIGFENQRSRGLVVNGYAYPYIDRRVLMETLPYLSRLTLFSYGFTPDGALIGMDDEPLIALANLYRAAPFLTLSSITETGSFSGERASLLFHDPVLQDQVLANLLEVMQEKGYLGLDVDFEYVNPNDRDAYVSFLQNAADQLHAAGYALHVDLAPKTSATQAGTLYEGHDYPAIGRIADTVLIMTYEWGYTYGPPMAVAPLQEVRRVVEYAVSEIPPEKIQLGIPNYGYDWLLPFVRGESRATGIGNQQALQIAWNNDAQIEFDETAQSPFFRYWDAQGQEHIVWFEDARSIDAKLDLIDEFGLSGAGYWNVMRPFVQNWLLVHNRFFIAKQPT